MRYVHTADKQILSAMNQLNSNRKDLIQNDCKVTHGLIICNRWFEYFRQLEFYLLNIINISHVGNRNKHNKMK